MSDLHTKQKQSLTTMQFLIGFIKTINIRSILPMFKTVGAFSIGVIPAILTEIPRVLKRFNRSTNKISILTSVVLVFSLIIGLAISLNNFSYENGTRDVPAYTEKGPEQLQLLKFYLDMDIKDAREILTDDYDEIVANTNKTTIEIDEIPDGYQIVFPDGKITASSDAKVETITFSGFLGATYLGIDVMGPQDFAQSFINRFQIPHFIVEDIDEVYWWSFTSPYGYKVRISQNDGTIVLSKSS